MNCSSIHSLPFSISYDGVAEVDSAFKISDNGDNYFESAFRGRKLIGNSTSIPSSLNVAIANLDDSKTGIILDKSIKINSDIKLFEWNKADLPEMSKIFISDYENLVTVQEKINSLFS